MTHESDDAEAAFVIACLRQAGVTLHVRGTDERLVIEFKEKRSRRVVGLVEVKRRLASARKSPEAP